MTNKIRKFIQKALTHEGALKYLANTSWLFGEQILRIIAGLFVGVYVARYLGPQNFGLFSYALAFVALFGPVAKLGLDGIVVRALVNAPEKRDLYLGTAFWLKMIGALLAVAGITVALLISENDLTTNLYIYIIATGLIFQSFEIIDFYFQSCVLSKYVTICKITQLLVSSILKLYLIEINADLIWFALVGLIDQMTLAAAMIYAYSIQKFELFYLNFNKEIAKQMLFSAKPLIISGILVSAYSSIDRVIIKELIGTREVGLYTAAAGLVSALYFAPYIIANSLFPAILNAKKQSEQIYNNRLSWLYKCILSFGLLISLFFSLFSTEIVSLIYGGNYSEASDVLQVYIWNFLPVCFSAIFGKWLLSENLNHLTTRFTLMAILINISSCYVLIPLWSIKGAAFAAVAAQLIPLIWFGIRDKSVNSQLKLAFFIYRRLV